MGEDKKAIGNRGAFHAPEDMLLCESGQTVESIARISEVSVTEITPSGRNLADFIADEASFMRVNLPEGWGGCDEDYDRDGGELTHFLNGHRDMMRAFMGLAV